MTFLSSKKLYAEDGYTLVELLVVIALASMMMTAVPAFASKLLPSARFDARFEALQGDLAKTRSRAMLTGEAIEFDFADYDDELEFTPDQLARSKDVGLVFYGRDGASGGTLVLTAGRRSRTLEIDWLTGTAFESDSGVETR